MATSCPICKKPVEPPGEQRPVGDVARSFFPFCSERCQLIDLGRWLDGKYQIPIDEADKDESGEGAG